MNELNRNNYYSMSKLNMDESHEIVGTEERAEYPVLILSQQNDSHSFNERRILLSDTVKVGRSVARAKPSDSNGIFDCKVLSRNHAVIWYENSDNERGCKVLLKDTKSSNGTYVNNQLLSKGSDDSIVREIYSGDIIQFGVEVVENTTTHGCIIAQVTILMPDGSELRKHTSDVGGLQSNGIQMSNYYEEQIYQLAQYIQEAAHREQTLEKKLKSLSQLILDTQAASEGSWNVILNQDQLLEKLEMLQQQVNHYQSLLHQDNHAGDSDDNTTVHHHQTSIIERFDLERENKTILCEMQLEKEEAIRKTVELQQILTNTEARCNVTRLALEEMSSKYSEVVSKLSEMEQIQKLLDCEIEQRAKLEREIQDGIIYAAAAAALEEEKQSNPPRDVTESNELVSTSYNKKLIAELALMNGGPNLAPSHFNTEVCQTLCQLHRLTSQLDAVTGANETLNDLVSQLTSSLYREICADVPSSVEVDPSPFVTEPGTGQDKSIQTVPVSCQESCTNTTQLPDKLQNPTQITALVQTEASLPNFERLQLLLQQKTDELTQQSNRYQSLQAQLLDMQASQVWYQVNTEDLLIKLTKLTEQNESLETEVQLLNSQIQASKEEMNVTQSNQLVSMREECEMLRNQLSKLQHQMHEKQEEYSRLSNEHSRLQRELDTYSTDINQQGDTSLDLQPPISNNQPPQQPSSPDHENIIVKQAQEIDSLRQQLTHHNSTLLTRSRRISALAVLPIIVLLLGVMMALLSFIAKPWLPLISLTASSTPQNNNNNL